MADWLPEGWQVGTEIGKDGSKSEYYYNKKSGQAFHTKNDMLRYANYLKNVKPHVQGFKVRYLDPEMVADQEKLNVYVDRPWEHDSEHTVLDYIQGCVANYTGQAPGSSSAMETDQELREEKREQKMEEMLMPSASTSVPVTGGKKPQPKKKKNKKKNKKAK